MNDLRTAWGWSAADELLHILPLHHMHGLMNCLLTPLAARATVRMLPRFEPQVVWSQMLHSGAPSASGSRVNLFMAVPTVYAKLLEHYDRHLSPTLPAVRVRATLTKNIRLMVCMCNRLLAADVSSATLSSYAYSYMFMLRLMFDLVNAIACWPSVWTICMAYNCKFKCR